MNNNIVILGAGESGVGAALLAHMKGYDVFVSDSGRIEPHYKRELEEAHVVFEEGEHSADKVLSADTIIKSPGIPDNIALIQKALSDGIPVINELEFAFRFTNKPIIAITGSNGKTTTTLLIHHLLSTSGMKAVLAGNVGHSLAREVLDDDADLYVIEVSSFQLDGMDKFKADTAVLLNITPDHLDRYDNSFEMYAESKMRIARNLNKDGLFIFCSLDSEVTRRVETAEIEANEVAIGLENKAGNAGFVKDEVLNYMSTAGLIKIPIEALPIRGPHNYLNALVAIAVVSHYGLNQKQILDALPSFSNAPHRLEFVVNINGIDFINDSKATNVEAVIYALGSFNQPIVWIAGGQDKGNDYSELQKLVSEKVKAMVCLGADNKKLYEHFEHHVDEISETNDVKVAAKMALDYANNTDVVLFSPACASFDLFNNYAERGDLYKAAVLDLKSGSDA